MVSPQDLMPLLPLLPLFHRLNREHFNGTLAVGSSPLVSVRWSNGRLRKTAGFYRRGPNVEGEHGCEIVLSSPVLKLLPQSATESTLCHEMIHAWVDLVLHSREGHGPNFLARMNAINAAQSIFQVTLRHQFPVDAESPRWWAICPSCSRKFPYQRRVKGAACRKCCDEQNFGIWNSRFLLVYEPAK